MVLLSYSENKRGQEGQGEGRKKAIKRERERERKRKGEEKRTKNNGIAVFNSKQA